MKKLLSPLTIISVLVALMSVPVFFTIPLYGLVFGSLYIAFAIAGLVVAALLRLIPNTAVRLAFDIVASIPMFMVLLVVLYNIINPDMFINW